MSKMVIWHSRSYDGSLESARGHPSGPRTKPPQAPSPPRSPALASRLTVERALAGRATAAPPGRVIRARALAALVAGALAVAAGIQLVSLPRQLEVGLPLAAAFAAASFVQIAASALLLRRPTRAARRLALLAALAPLLLWAATRTLAITPGQAPGQEDPWGPVAAALELAGATALALGAAPPTATPVRRRLWATGGALAFAAGYLLATGSAGLSTGSDGAPPFQAYTLTGDFSITVPAVVLYAFGGRLFVTIPWSTAVFLPIAAGLLAAQISLALEQTSCRRRLAGRRRGVLSIAPAMFAAPVCCGAPLLAFLGTGAVLTLASITPWLLISTCLLLAGGLYRQQRAGRSAAR